jgi:hypothetical protein
MRAQDSMWMGVSRMDGLTIFVPLARARKPVKYVTVGSIHIFAGPRVSCFEWVTNEIESPAARLPSGARTTPLRISPPASA